MRKRKTTCCGVECAATHSSSSSRCSSDSVISVLFCAMQERRLPASHLSIHFRDETIAFKDFATVVRVSPAFVALQCTLPFWLKSTGSRVI